MTQGRRIPWLALGLLAMALLLFLEVRATLAWSLVLPPCPLKLHFGVPCVTCGLTRCAIALVQGRWAEAFHWHPVAVLLGMAAPLVLVWDGWRAWKGDPYPSLPDSLPARLGVAGLLAGTWVLQLVRGI
jgi:hypothetical protein